MNKTLIALFFLLLPLFVSSAELIADKSVLAEKNCFRQNYSDYDIWRESTARKYQNKFKTEVKIKRALARFDRTFTQEAFSAFKEQLTCQTFEYLVDGIKVNGFIIKPKGSTEKLPVVIYNRGGNGGYSPVEFSSMMYNLFSIAQQGFVIVGSQYRGTFYKDKTHDDEFGGKDVNDVMALIKLIPSITGADDKRIGMLGASRGGMQTYLTLKQTDKVKAVAVIAGVADLIIQLKERPRMERVYKQRIPNYAQNKQAELEKRSVLKWLNKIPQAVPMLLLHGMSDERVSVEQSITLAEALEKADMPHKLVLYPGDNHGLVQNKKKATQEIVAWFNTYL